MKYFYLVTIFLFLHLAAFAQTKSISGRVKDASNGETMPGVNVSIKGTTTGTATDMNGEFKINASVGDSILFTFIGKKPVTEAIGQRSVLEVSLYDDEKMIEEVVVTAFGKAKKTSVASSIESVKVSELRIPSSNLTTALAGKIAGIISYQTSGEPGADNAQFFVRGVSSFGYKKDPLILIDGFESTSDDLARLRPDDIESFSVMKDAAATVMYGARSANGIISVVTKSGNEGPVRISARVDVNMAMPTQNIEFLDGVTYMRLYNEAYMGRDPLVPAFYDEQKIQATARGENPMIYPNVDWYNALFNKYTMNEKANMSVSGGGQVANYYVAGGFDHETGLLKVDKRNNFNNNININRTHLRSNVVFKLGHTTTLDTRINGRFERYTGPYESATRIYNMVMRSNPVDFPFTYEPDDAHQDVEHILFGSTLLGSGIKVNPYAEMVRGYEDRNESNITMQATLNQDFSFITPGLKASLKLSANSWSKYSSRRQYDPFYYALDSYDIITGDFTLFPLNPGSGDAFLGNVQAGRDASVQYYYEAIVNWNRKFGKHDVGATLVGIAQENLITGGNSALITETLPEKNMGLSGKATYMYDDKYILEFIFGYNGSEKFTGTNQYGFFPAVAGAWIASRESFFEPLSPVVKSLKFKASLGKGGNDAIAGRSGRFFFLSNIETYPTGIMYRWGNLYQNAYGGYNVTRYANPNITWESSLQFNAGFELGLFRSEALKIQFDVFREMRSNIYMTRENFPSSAGLEASIAGNVGKVEKLGFDGSIDYQYEFSRDLWMQGRFNITYSHNEYVELDEKNYPDEYRKRKGHPMDQKWGYIGERLFVDEHEIAYSPKQDFEDYQAGDIKYKDVNGDGKVDENDQIPLGYPTSPEVQYGFGLSTGYKRWDLSFFFQGNARVSMFIDADARWNDDRSLQEGIAPFVDQRNALPLIANDYWSETKPNPHAFWPRLSTKPLKNNVQQSSWWLRDASFIRLKSVELGYNMPGWDKIHMRQCRIYLSAENVFVLSKFKLWDPEMGSNGIKYPPNRRINVGVKLDF